MACTPPLGRLMTPSLPVTPGPARGVPKTGGWEVAGMWIFNSGRPWGLPQNVFYVKDATIKNVDFGDPNVIRAYLGEAEDEPLPPAVAADLSHNA